MPRRLRLHIPGAFYHVTLRGNHRRDIFFKENDQRILCDLIAEVIERFGARLHAYCFMTNHVHLLIQVADMPLGRLMLHIAGRYARTIQVTLDTTGHLFEKRYHSVLVDADEYLLELLRYIHLNPVRAHMVASPDDYPWSSHHVYAGKREESWVTTDFVLSRFHWQRSQAMHAYRQFIYSHIGQSTTSPLDACNPHDHRILGGDDFAARMLGDAWHPCSHKTLEEIIGEACTIFSIMPEHLVSTSRAASLVKARAWIAYQAITLRVAPLARVARRLNRDESSLRHGVKHHFGGV
ncbi:hypothetical protein ACG33_10560 [Steroidobacter denitrificans]|uniref:Transposase n=1 Tax=Steroidobacter denitrificans TaxID=465721 RepID=A0A127FD48_STEDE|nr:transposase [Steroidobacter denitrificans]AMN47531.1 hypothetical protein ACG33_10560 [Steroidobacter denitrificans]